jgi:radical SAM protein with 4Fe4S-binding SPASM domain
MNHPILSNMINVETTNKCPASCVICPRDSFEPKLDIMSMSLFKKVIDDAAQYNCACVNTCGFGDPFTDPYFWERCEYVKEKLPNTKIYASTTGYLMGEKHYANIIKYIDILKISFFGMSRDTYYKMHHLNMDKSLDNILGFLAEKQSNKKPYISGLFVETEINKHQRAEWIDFWKPLLDEIYAWKPHNWLDKRYRIVDKTNQVSCNRPFTTVYIHVNGDVSVCCWDLNKGVLIGNINTQTFEEIYNSKEIKLIQEKHKSCSFGGLICGDCDQTNPDPSNLLYTSKNRKLGDYAFEVKE